MSSASGKRFRERNPWYQSWMGARRRCEDENHSSYQWYGAKGIKFRLTREECIAIYERDNGHLLKKPSLDRLKADQDYCYENCTFIEFVENGIRAHKGISHAVGQPHITPEEPNPKEAIWLE